MHLTEITSVYNPFDGANIEERFMMAHQQFECVCNG